MSTEPRIVFLTTGLLTGGAEMMLWQLTSRLKKQNFEPVVVSLRAEGPLRPRFEDAGIAVCSPDMNPARPSPLAWLRLVRMLRALQPAILQGWMYHANVAAAWSSRFLKPTPVLFSIHNSIYDLRSEKPLTAWVIRHGARLSRKTDRVIYCAESTARQHEELGYDRERSIVIHNGFDVEQFKPQAEAKCELRSSLSIPDSTFVVGLVARFDVHKDHDNFFTMARLVADRIPQVRFVLAGKGIDPSNSALMELIARHAIIEHVCLLGERSDIPNLMAGFDVLVSSSSSEALPSVVGEAMACEVPCCVTDVGDSKLMVGGHGEVVPVRDAQALAQAVIKISSLSDDEHTALGRACRTHIVQNFSISSMVSSYAKVYQQTL